MGPSDPSFRVRTRIPAAELARHGVRLEHAPLFTEFESRAFARGSVRQLPILLRARRRTARRLMITSSHQTVLIQRQVDLLPSLTLERRAIAGRRVVLDLDDAIWADTEPTANAHPLAFLKGSRRKARWLAAAADVVVAGNDLLADWLSHHASHVVVVPSLVDPRITAVRRHTDGQRVILGWIGSRTTGPYLQRLVPALQRLAGVPRPRYELVVVGAPAPEIPRMLTRSIAWSEAAERDLLARMDIGLMPLPDTPWTRGKCAYKALQYMNAGIPAVADDVGISAAVIGHGLGGLIATGSAAWAEAIAALGRDPALRGRLGGIGRQRVEDHFSVQRWAPVLAEALTDSRATSAPPGEAGPAPLDSRR